VAGIAVVCAGGWQLLTDNFLWLGVLLAGVDLLLRPDARRKVPRVDKLTLKELDRWRSPPPVP